MHSTHATKTGAVKKRADQSRGNVKVNGGAVGERAKVNDMPRIASDFAHGGIANVNDVARSRVDRDHAGFPEKDGAVSSGETGGGRSHINRYVNGHVQMLGRHQNSSSQS